MTRHVILAFAALAALVGCESNEGSGGSGGEGGSGGSPRTCATDIGVREVQAFGMQTPSTTEGITFDAEGNLFVSAIEEDANDQLLAFMPDGTFEPVAEAESILGLESHADGILAAGIDTGELLLIDPVTGTTEVIAQDLGAPNFVLTTPWDTILVSDDSPGEDTIDEVTWEGVVSTWVEGVPTPNGMVFSLDHRTLYVASTFEEPGLWRVPVSVDGQAGTPEIWVSFPSPPATTPDGVAIDSEGNVYVALNVAARIAQVNPDGDWSIIAEDVSSVASLAFGQGEFDPCSIYATSLFGTQLWRVGIGIPGTEK
jgi:sugar lactone lactonase YvrE